MSSLGFKRGWTPFPNSLIDLYMPTLTDTEWRILVTVVRATLGWQHEQSGKRLPRVCLSNWQLKKRTGRQSAAISAAVESLSVHRLIIIRDGAGVLLDSPSQRRRAKTTLYFELAPWIHSFSTASARKKHNRISESEKNKRYLDKRNNKETPLEPDSHHIK